MIKLGFHVSIAGSVANAPRYAAEMGYGDFQLFVSSSRSWAHKRIPGRDAKEFIELDDMHSLTPFAHIPYLCNLASANADVYRKSRNMLVGNMRNCAQLKVGSIVIHLGSHLGKGAERGIARICDALEFALDSAKGVDILLENSAGYTNSVGSKLQEIGKIIDTVSDSRIGVCFDTCHAFAAGYDIRTSEGVDAVAQEFKSSIGKGRLKLIHLNDAKHQLGSGLDRHWHIGKGHIGMKGFINLFRNSLFDHGFFVLETPANEEGNDETNIRTVEEIIRVATGRSLTNG